MFSLLMWRSSLLLKTALAASVVYLLDSSTPCNSRQLRRLYCSRASSVHGISLVDTLLYSIKDTVFHQFCDNVSMKLLFLKSLATSALPAVPIMACTDMAVGFSLLKWLCSNASLSVVFRAIQSTKIKCLWQ